MISVECASGFCQSPPIIPVKLTLQPIAIPLVLTLALSALLTGCFEDDQILLPEPPVEEAPRLEEGAYEVQVAAVDLLDCPGVRVISGSVLGV